MAEYSKFVKPFRLPGVPTVPRLACSAPVGTKAGLRNESKAISRSHSTAWKIGISSNFGEGDRQMKYSCTVESVNEAGKFASTEFVC